MFRIVNIFLSCHLLSELKFSGCYCRACVNANTQRFVFTLSLVQAIDFAMLPMLLRRRPQLGFVGCRLLSASALRRALPVVGVIDMENREGEVTDFER